MWTGAMARPMTPSSCRGKTIIAPWYQIETGRVPSDGSFPGALATWSFGKGSALLTCLQAFNQGVIFSQFLSFLTGSQQASGPEQVKVDQSGLGCDCGMGRPSSWRTTWRWAGTTRPISMSARSVISMIKKNTLGRIVLRPGAPGDRRPGGGGRVAQPIPMSNSLFCIGARLDQPGSTR